MPGVPHTRGDEPIIQITIKPLDIAFPTHVGMNRPSGHSARCSLSVPHTRGDEPAEEEARKQKASRSPHTWG